MTILIAGILSISSEYYEAASIDGATGWQKVPVYYISSAVANSCNHNRP